MVLSLATQCVGEWPVWVKSGLGIVLATDTIWRVLTAPYGLSSPR